jgi:hypothetical protein
MRVSWREAPFLTRGEVCKLLVQFAVTLQTNFLRTHEDVLLSHFRPLGSIFATTWLAGLRWSYSNTLPFGQPFLLKFKLQPTVSRPVCLSVGLPSETCDHRSIIWLYNCFWVLPKQSISGPNLAELTTTFYYLIWDTPNPEGHVSVFISRRKRVA